MILRARQFEFVFPRPALVMGIVNVTPDSFSDGGRFFEADAAVAQALQLAAEGADIIDVGGESTRPKAAPVSEAEEMHRVLPVIGQLAGKLALPISIDTMKPAVAQAALEAGASMVNDINAAHRNDDGLWRSVARTGAGYVLMHMQGRPKTMQENPVYGDVVAEVNEFFRERLNRLQACGVEAEQITIDVGIGFGKRLEHNLRLLGQLREFAKWQRPILLGVSRKSFMGQLLGVEVENRLSPSLACACWAAQNGARIIRTHDVAATRLALRMTEALIAQQ